MSCANNRKRQRGRKEVNQSVLSIHDTARRAKWTKRSEYFPRNQKVTPLPMPKRTITARVTLYDKMYARFAVEAMHLAPAMR